MITYLCVALYVVRLHGNIIIFGTTKYADLYGSDGGFQQPEPLLQLHFGHLEPGQEILLYVPCDKSKQI